MKNYIIHLALRNIQQNKKRYLYLSVGIMLSIFLISSILTIVDNVKLNAIEMEKNSEGDHYFSFIETDYKSVDLLKNEKVDKDSISCVSFETGLLFSQLHNIKVDLVSFDRNALKLMFPITIKQGRMAKASNEVIIEEWVSRRAGEKINIGDSIDTVINGKSERFTVVGFYDNFNTSQYSGKVNFYSISDSSCSSYFWNKGIWNIYFKLKPEINISGNISYFSNMVGKDHFKANLRYINLLEKQKKGGGIFEKAIILPVIFISIIIIFNSLNISLQQRIKYFGLLRTIGSSKRHVILCVLVEVTMIYTLVAPIGIFLSIIFVKIILPNFNLVTVIGSNITIFPYIYLKSVIITIATAVLSSLVPAIYASRISPIGTSYAEGLAKKKRKKNAFTTTGHGMEIRLAKINMKRNKKRYKITLLSVIISVILFVIFASFSSMSLALLKVAGEDIKLTASMYRGEEVSENSFEKLYNQLGKVKNLEKIYKRYENILAYSYIPEKKLDKKYSDYEKKDICKISGSNYVEMRTLFDVYDAARLKNSCMENYLMKGSFSSDKMLNEDEVLVIQKARFTDKLNQNKYFNGNTVNLNEGDKIKVKLNKNSNDTAELRVAGILTNRPFATFDGYNNSTVQKIDSFDTEIKIVISEKLMNKLLNEQYRTINKKHMKLIGYDIVAKKANSDIEEFLNIASSISGVKFVEMTDTIEKRKESFYQIELIMLILVLLAASVALINLFNTCSANIITRKREFAMMKAIGVSEKQINKIVNLEGIIYGVKGSIYGVVLSTVFAYYAYYLIRSMEYFNWNMPLWIPVICIVVIIIVGYLSTIMPLKRVNKENIINIIKTDIY